MTTPEIRPVVESDLPRLMGLDHSSSTDRVWQLELRREPSGPQVTATFREVRLPRPVNLVYPNDPFSLAERWKGRAIMLAAVAGKEAVGYLVMLEERPAAAWITDLVVAPLWRRQGLASALLAAAQSGAADRTRRKVFLEMQSKNHAGIRLAQKHGYEFCGYNDHYYSTNDVALFFARAP